MVLIWGTDMEACEPNNHDFIIDDFNDLVCKKCKHVWMDVTPNTKLLQSSTTLY